MESPFVLDASATIAWLLNEDGRGPELEPYMSDGGGRIVTPWLWRIEVVNVLLVLERRRKITPESADARLKDLDALAVEIVPEPGTRTLKGLAELARPHQLTAYDATYLELAASRNLPILTLDNNLRDAARRMGQGIVWHPK